MHNLDLRMMKYIRTQRKPVDSNDLLNKFGTHSLPIISQLSCGGLVELRNENGVSRYRLTAKGLAECGRYQYDRQLKLWECAVHYILGLLSGLLIALVTSWIT